MPTKLQVVYPLYSEDKQVWRYCKYNDYKIKNRLNIVTSQTERKIVSTAVAQIITYRSKDMTSIRRL